MKRASLYLFALLTVALLASCETSGGDDGNKRGDSTDDYVDGDFEEPPRAPSDLKVEFVGKYKIVLSWLDNSDNEDGFILERLRPDSIWDKIADLPADATEYTDAPLDCDGVKYEYRLKAYNSGGESDYSNTAEATTIDCWTVFSIDSAGIVGWYNSIALDSNDKIHASYLDYLNKDLKYATNAFGGWQICAIDSAKQSGFYSSLALDSNGKPHMSYYVDYPEGDLKYAKNPSGVWQMFVIDSSGDVGSHTSIAIDSNDKVHISYYDCGERMGDRCTKSDLKYATNLSGAWQTFVIDDDEHVGLHTSIALDSNGKAHISYYDFGNDDLKYATNAFGEWRTFVIDSAEDVGLYTSIAIDSNDNVHISYYDFSNSNLKYATNLSGAWQTFVIDSEGDVGLYSSIALDSNDKVHISYYDLTNGDLKYATNAFGNWQTFAIDSEGDVGLYTSIKVDSKDMVYISYYNQTRNDFRYATTAEIE